MNRAWTFALLAGAALTVGCASHAPVVKGNQAVGSGTGLVPTGATVPAPAQVPQPGPMSGALPGGAPQPGMTSTSAYRSALTATPCFQ
jgi:hypothetical protein